MYSFLGFARNTDLVAVNATVKESKGEITLTAEDNAQYSWCSIDPGVVNSPLNRASTLIAKIKNCGSCDVNVLLWAVGSNGWNCSAGSATIDQGDTATVTCDLRATFPDGTPKLDPNKISHIEVMIVKPQQSSKIIVTELSTQGDEHIFKADNSRLLLPEVYDEKPTAGKRVRYKLSSQSNLYGVLYLPKDWKSGRSYPMIVEFPGNIFYTQNCYSTGLPEQCTIGYGVSKGEGVILLSLPFVDYKTGEIAPNGWGNPDDSADYTIKMVEDICKNYGADRKRIMLTGFSRGAIACGFIGLRNKQIASLWSAIHCCQHFDGDGWGKSTYEDATKRLLNGLNIPQFHTDNDNTELKTMLSTAQINTTYVNSELGAHACDMFLDDRASTVKLRKWFWNIVTDFK